MTMRLGVHRTGWPMRAPFAITGYVFDSLDTVVVSLEEDGLVGRGEGVGVYYLNEDSTSMLEQIESVRRDVEHGISLEQLQELLPAGGARNALDCALWDLTAKRTGKTIWELTGIEAKPRQTALTIGIQETPEQMAEEAARATGYRLLKIKLDDVDPVERITAIRDARPDASIIIDANQGFSFSLLKAVLEPFADLEVAMVEQPLRRGGDDELKGFHAAIPICADESCLHRGDLPTVLERYDMVNIKLDKTGGLTEALALTREAREAGKRLMVGNMLGTSLSMAPAFVIAQLCDFVDLDGPLALKSDYAGGMKYNGDVIDAPAAGLWGSPS